MERETWGDWPHHGFKLETMTSSRIPVSATIARIETARGERDLRLWLAEPLQLVMIEEICPEPSGAPLGMTIPLRRVCVCGN